MTGSAPTTRLEPHKGRTPGAHVVVALALAGFVGLGLVKPWDASAPREPVGGAEASPDVAADMDPRAAAAGLPQLSWDRVERLIQPRSDWGVRAILARKDDAPSSSQETAVAGWTLSEEWASVPLRTHYDAFKPDRKSELSGGVTIDSGPRVVAAIGITSPLTEMPLDVRAWRLRGGDVAERLALDEVPGRGWAVDRLFLPPATGSHSEGTRQWAPGAYRFDLLLGRRVARLTVVIPGVRAAPLDPLDEPPVGVPIDKLEGLPSGPFVVTGEGDPIHVLARAGHQLGEVGAWLAQPRLSDPPGPVGVVASADIRLIGLKLAPDQQVVDARLFSLAPERDRVGRMRLGRGGLDSGLVEPYGATGHNYVYFEPDAGRWAGGVYRIDLESTGPAGRDGASWHVDIVPSTQRTFGSFLRLLQRARPYAGRPVVVGRSVPRYGTAATAIVHRPRAGTKADAPTAGWCSGGVRFESPQRAVAFGHTLGVVPEIRISLIARDNSRAPVRLAVAAPAVDGVALVAPAGGMGWLPGRYEVTLAHAERGGLSRSVERFLLCFRTPASAAP